MVFLKKILIIEDDADISGMIAATLEKHSFACAAAYSGTEGLMCLRGDSFDLVLLDLMLPGKSGETVLRELRECSHVPVIVISAKDELDNKVDLLMSGADDYITKPFQMKELVARVYVCLRKSGAAPDDTRIVYKRLVLDKSSYTATLCGQKVPLTHQEFNILELIFGNPKKVFSKKEIFNYAWEEYYEGEDKTINVHISHIRIKLKAITEEPYIETVWGIGFKAAE